MANQINELILSDGTLTSDSFSLNSNGTVTIKNHELSKLLKVNPKNELANSSVNAINAGIPIETRG